MLLCPALAGICLDICGNECSYLICFIVEELISCLDLLLMMVLLGSDVGYQGTLSMISWLHCLFTVSKTTKFSKFNLLEYI